jgi:hypothetical protein
VIKKLKIIILITTLCSVMHAVSEEGDDELQALLQNFSTGGDSADAYEQQQQQPASQVNTPDACADAACAFASVSRTWLAWCTAGIAVQRPAAHSGVCQLSGVRQGASCHVQRQQAHALMVLWLHARTAQATALYMYTCPAVRMHRCCSAH